MRVFEIIVTGMHVKFVLEGETFKGVYKGLDDRKELAIVRTNRGVKRVDKHLLRRN